MSQKNDGIKITRLDRLSSPRSATSSKTHYKSKKVGKIPTSFVFYLIFIPH